MPLKAVLKVINLFLGLAAFLAVGYTSLTDGEEPVWSVAKAVGCFLACWLILGYLANLLSLAVEGPQAMTMESEPAGGGRKGKKKG